MVRMTILVLLSAGAALLMHFKAQAWGSYAHGVTAEIAEANVSPFVRGEIRKLLRAEAALGTPECRIRTIAEASVWADCVRRTRWRWGYTASWHYHTMPICEAYNPQSNCPGGSCVTAQIERNHRMLADEDLPAHIRLEALAFMVHFAGDIHMPLHSGDNGDRGGNDLATDYGIVPGLNLHWIWDGPLAERAITTGADQLIRRYSKAERAELGGGAPEDWGRESWRIAREFVYPNAFDKDPCAHELDDATALTQDDIEQATPVVRRRIRQAGLRIAELLESAFAPGPLPEREGARR